MAAAMGDAPYASMFPDLQLLHPYAGEADCSSLSSVEDAESLEDILRDFRATHPPSDEQQGQHNGDITPSLPESAPLDFHTHATSPEQEIGNKTSLTDQEAAKKRPKTTIDDWTDRTLEQHFIPNSVGYEQLDRLAEPGFEKYDLRLGPRLGNLVPSCFVDQDHTEDFNPHRPNKIFDVLPLKRKRESIYEEGYEPIPRSRPQGPQIQRYQYGRQVGKSLIVKLRFETDSGRQFCQMYGRNSGIPLDGPGGGADNLSFDSARTDNAPSTELTQRRCRKLDISRRSSDEDEDGEGILKLEDLTLGHPAARGCKACFELGLQCDLLHEGSSYPCTVCLHDGEECELITEPREKRGCEGCKKRRIVCSYRQEGSDHSLPCFSCTLKGYKCVAGPLTGRTRTGPSLDQPTSLLSDLPTAHHTSTHQLKQPEEAIEKPKPVKISREEEAKVKAGVKTRSRQLFINAMWNPEKGGPTLEQEEPKTAASVRQQRIDEMLNPIPRQEHNAPTPSFYAKPKPSDKKQQSIRTVGGILAPLPRVSRHSGYIVTNPYSYSSLPTPPSTPSPSKSLGTDTGLLGGLPGKFTITPKPAAFLFNKPSATAATKTIRTRLAHPIQLNFVPPRTYPGAPTTSDEPACHFHPVSPHSILGLGAVTPTVFDSPDGDGYTELSGGHIADGYVATRMCGTCKRERVGIIECGKHELESLPQDQTYQGEPGQAVSTLMGDQNGASFKWCHVCPTPAAYKCTKTRVPTGRACGLCLCETCTMRLVGEFDGMLESFLGTMMEENDEGMGFGVRPDVEMLSKRGEVARRFGGGILRTLL